MNLPNKLLILIGLSLASIPFVRADDDTYVRLSAVGFIPSAGGSDYTTGALVSLGETFDDRFGDPANQFEMEIGYAKWNYPGADLTAVPVLFTYRYQWNFGERLGLAIGPSVGGSYLGVTAWNGAWIFSYGAGVQLNFKVSDNVAFTLGYRYLINSDATLFNVKATDLDMQLVEVGLRIGWPY